MKQKFQHVYYKLDELIEKYSNQDTDNDTDDDDDDDTYDLDESDNTILTQSELQLDKKDKLYNHLRTSIINIRKEFDNYIHQLPVIGFNSGKYDINLIKNQIIRNLSENYKPSEISTIKKTNSYLSITTPNFRFLDISNYLAAGCRYSKFLKVYECEIVKGIFQYVNSFCLYYP